MVFLFYDIISVVIFLYKVAIEILNIISNNGYEAYIVGGFVRDKLLDLNSNDIDITTNATYEEISNIFHDLSKENYGSFSLKYKGYSFDVTTYRKEHSYLNNRKPIDITYTNSLIEDLKRRDFTINAICIDKDENYIDMFNGINDLQNKLIRSIGNSNYKIKQDALRILRAIRFSTLLNFDLENNLIKSIKNNLNLLYNISYDRKMIELNYIFSSSNIEKGINLLTYLKIDKILEIGGLNNVKRCSNINGIWAQINYSEKYNFSKKDKNQILQIKKIIESTIIDNRTLYDYDINNILISCEILNIDKEKVICMYENMPIYNRKDVCINYNEIKSMYPRIDINKIYVDLENKILYNELKNNKSEILKYLDYEYGRGVNL